MAKDTKMIGPFTFERVLGMVRHLVRVPQLFRNYRDVLRDSCFKAPKRNDYENEDYDELPLRIIWQALKDYYTEQCTLEAPSKGMLTQYVLERIARMEDQIEGLREVMVRDDPNSGYIAYMYDPSVEVNEATGKPIITQFLTERVVANDVANLITYDGSTAENLPDVLRTLAEQSNAIRVMGSTYEFENVIPGQEYFEKMADDNNGLVKTNIPWIDAMLGGGQRRKECNGLMGATGAGKTTLALQMAVANVKDAVSEALINHTTPEAVLFYTFEQSHSQLWPRVASNGASIERSRITQAGTLKLSNDPSAPLPYEAELWPDAADRVSEVERFQDMCRILNGNLFIRNMSGVSDEGDTDEQARQKSSLGRNGIDGIAFDAMDFCNKTGRNIHTIYIDYAGLVCSRRLGVNESDPDALRRALAQLGDLCRFQLAGQLNCTVWLLHQLSGAACGRSPTDIPHHSWGANCKTIVDNMSNCLCLGAPDHTEKSNGGGACMYANFSKRRNSGGGRPYVVLQHDKYFYRLNDVSDNFKANKNKKRFVEKGF